MLLLKSAPLPPAIIPTCPECRRPGTPKDWAQFPIEVDHGDDYACEHCRRSWGNRKKHIAPPQLISGYDGETDVKWNGHRWSIRHHQAHTVKADYQSSCDAHIGTVRGHGDNMHEFPPAELMAYYPGYVRARYRLTGTFHETKWTGGILQVPDSEFEAENPPRVEHYSRGLRAVAWREDMEAAGVEVGP